VYNLQIKEITLKLAVCILLRVLGQVQGFRLAQHWFEYFIQQPLHVSVVWPSSSRILNISFSNRYMFRSYDHLQAEFWIFYLVTATCFGRTTIFRVKYIPWLLYAVRLTCVYNLKVGCLHPVACTRSGSGFPSNATLVWIFYSVTDTCFGLMTIFR
jgi:hypothetical protein